MSKLRKKLILVGRAASGKTTLKEELVREWGLKPEISYTTRPPRPGEVDGKDYHFISRGQFIEMITMGKMLEYDEFNKNYYGTSLEEFNDCDVMIMTPDGVQHASRVRPVCFVIYVYAPHSTVIDRLAARHKIKDKKDMSVVQERINADNLQFKTFEQNKMYDIEVDSTMPLSLMLSLIKKYQPQYS